MAIRLSDTELLVTINGRHYVLRKDDVDAIGGPCPEGCWHCKMPCDQLAAAHGHGHVCRHCRKTEPWRAHRGAGHVQ